MTERKDTRQPRREGMTRDELILAEPIAATEAVPEDLLRDFRRIDGVERGADQALVRAAQDGGRPGLPSPSFRGWRRRCARPRRCGRSPAASCR